MDAAQRVTSWMMSALAEENAQGAEPGLDLLQEAASNKRIPLSHGGGGEGGGGNVSDRLCEELEKELEALLESSSSIGELFEGTRTRLENRMQGAIRNLTQHAFKLREELQASRETICEKDMVIAEKDKVISSLESALQERTGAIDALQEALRAHHATHQAPEEAGEEAVPQDHNSIVEELKQQLEQQRERACQCQEQLQEKEEHVSKLAALADELVRASSPLASQVEAAFTRAHETLHHKCAAAVAAATSAAGEEKSETQYEKSRETAY